MPGRVEKEQPLHLSPLEREELESRSRSLTSGTEESRRARLILLLEDGRPFREIQSSLHCNEHYILRWKRRFLAERLAGLYSRHAGRPPTAAGERLFARVEKALATGAEPAGCRELARALGVPPALVSRVLAVKVRDPACPPRSAARAIPATSGLHPVGPILGIYVKPRQHVLVFQHGESSPLPSFEGFDPLVLLSLGQAPSPGAPNWERATEELSALVASGELLGPNAGRHTSAEIVAFLSEIAAYLSADRFEVVADNPATLRGARFRRFLTAQESLCLRSVGSVAAWLAEVETRLTQIRSHSSAAGTSTAGFAARLMELLKRACSEERCIKWLYRPTT
ncbi:MAG TPA: helix-turn-helix domain-containing protein [Thermoanaerobaculia bacterium]|nr:helix-turn-helix domain-containing protein [Thermoanaerobaculia bacterium]